MLQILEGMFISYLLSILRKSIIVFSILIGLLAVIWFSHVFWVSRVVGGEGGHPVYLQMGGSKQVTMRWCSEKETKETVYYGLSPDELTNTISDHAAVMNHRITLTDLQPNTRYYYRVKLNGVWQQPAAEWFMTAPEPGNSKDTRIWLLGDPGKSAQKVPVREAAMNWLRANPRAGKANLDLILSTGDQAYPNGTYAEYVKEFLMPYQAIFKNVSVWPALGNHDARRWTFYKLFDRPENGEFGGLASKTKSYFSFDYAQTHIILLDSQDGDLSVGSDMLKWLEKDLSQSNQKWKIVVFHHPPYTRGTHDSDVVENRKQRMQRVRQNILPILESAGVDLVITGHSHAYERSHLINDHYGKSDTFDPGTMIKAKGQLKKGRTDYTKLNAAGGTMYMVLGSSGEGNQCRFDHPALPVSSAKAGSVFLDIDNESLRSRYVAADGKIFDKFTIRKMTALSAAQ